MSREVRGPLFEKVDCVMVKVDDLEKGLDFYHRKLGHEVLWKTASAAGLKFPDSNAELVLSTESGPEVDLKVQNTLFAFEMLVSAGAKPIAKPFEIAIGQCAVLEDPWGNAITILDTNKGLLKVDSQKNVVGNVTDREFKGMNVEESLLDPSIMNELSVERVQITSPSRWHIYNVKFSEHQIDQCSSWLKDGPWYMHFWHGDEILAVFKERTFRFSRSDKSTWKPVLTHGQTQGIPEAQLDFLTE